MAGMEHKPKSNEQKDVPKLQASNFAAGAETGGAAGNDGGDNNRNGDSSRVDLSRASFSSSDRESFRAELTKNQSTPEHQAGGAQFSTGNNSEAGNQNNKTGEQG